MRVPDAGRARQLVRKLDDPRLKGNHDVVVDDRVPGDGNLVKREYKCGYPGGCTETLWSFVVPTCPKHRKRMTLKESAGKSSNDES